MNPLNASSSLNAERARLEGARSTARLPEGNTGTAGFAQFLQGAQEAAVPPDEARTRGAAPAPRAPDEPPSEEGPRDGVQAADEDAAGDPADKPRETGPTLAHWLLHGGANADAAAAAAAAMPPAQQPGAPTDDLKAAAMARQVLDAVRQRSRLAGKAGAEPAGEAAGPGEATGRLAAARARPGSADVAGTAGSAAAQEPLREPLQGEKKGQDRFGDVLQQHLTPAGTAAPAAGGEAALPAATATAAAAGHDPRIDTPVHDAGFGQAVGVTISRLAKEGRHEAHLQLNPAELGPVSVRIEMQGQEARLSLGAAHAETRALLDASLPALTEAFRADGLVLAASQVGDLGRDGTGTGAGAFAGQTGQDAGGMFSRGQQSGGGGEGPRGQAGRGEILQTSRITLPVPSAAASSGGGSRGASPGALDLYA